MFETAFFVVFAVVGVAVGWMLFRGELAGRVDARTLAGQPIRLSVVREAAPGDHRAPGVRLQYRFSLAISAFPLSGEEALAIAEALERVSASAES